MLGSAWRRKPIGCLVRYCKTNKIQKKSELEVGVPCCTCWATTNKTVTQEIGLVNKKTTRPPTCMHACKNNNNNIQQRQQQLKQQQKQQQQQDRTMV